MLVYKVYPKVYDSALAHAQLYSMKTNIIFPEKLGLNVEIFR